MIRLDETFYRRPCLEAAEALVGKLIVHHMPEGDLLLRITETEAYCGEADTACHAHKGRTARTWVMYEPGGAAYIYLCYGIHWLMNVVTGEKDAPEAVLIRACEGAEGPGRLTKALKIDGSFNARDLSRDEELYIADDGFRGEITTAPRIGIGYASEEDQKRPWRFILVR